MCVDAWVSVGLLSVLDCNDVVVTAELSVKAWMLTVVGCRTFEMVVEAIEEVFET
jgi:hypothetical protein